jgi:hypothetical protein
MSQAKTYDGDAILALPLEQNRAKAKTVRGYLIALLRQIFREDEEFNGKRPFGQSGWQQDIAIALIKGGIIDGALDEDGFVDRCNDIDVNLAVQAAIDRLEAGGTR